MAQIDQQAAESLKKNENPSRSDDRKFHVPTKTGGGGGGGGTVSLKEQLKKKATHETINSNTHEYFGKLNTDTNNIGDFSNVSSNSNGGEKEIANAPKPFVKARSTLTDSDWTELLSTPTQATTSSSSNRSNGVSVIRGLRKDGGRRQGSPGSNFSVLEGKMNLKSSGGVKSKKRLDVALGNRLNGKPSDEEESTSSARSSSVELHSDAKNLDREDLDHKDIVVDLMEKQSNKGYEKKGGLGLTESRNISEENILQGGKGDSSEMSCVSEKVGEASDVKKGVSNVYDRLRNTVKGKHRSGSASRSAASDDLEKGSSTSDEGSDSDSDSVSTSDSENEQEREMREKILAQKAAAKALEVIKERENMVARLEGEKQSLEKILEERAKQQAQEVSFLFGGFHFFTVVILCFLFASLTLIIFHF